MRDSGRADAVRTRLDAMEAFLPALESRLLEMQRGNLDIGTKSNDVDLVTHADLESERALLEFIREQFPDDGVVSEEGSHSAAESARSGGFRWILDPIDGTVNYANRLPGWSISVGLLDGSEPVGGIVSAPGLRERYRAEKGGGAHLNGEPIRVNAVERLRQGLVVTGFPYDRAQRADPLSRALRNILIQSGGVRRLGSAALDFCFIAGGRFVGYYEMALKPWDSAAGSLIAAEAGATVTDMAGKPFDLFTSRGVVVSNGRVHDELVQAVAPMLEAIAINVESD